MKLTDLIKESKQTYDYGCVMGFFKFPLMDKIHKTIDENDIYTEDDDNSYGLETEPHITLLYGLHDEVTIDDIKEKLKGIKFGDCIVYNASLFENPKYDVLKFDVRNPIKYGSFLHSANKRLKELPFTSDYPDYHPHMTIAYLKGGSGKKYVKNLKDKEFPINFDCLVFSTSDGKKIKF